MINNIYIDDNAILNIDFNEYAYKNEFLVECRYLMTSITLNIKKNNDKLLDTILLYNKNKLNQIINYKKFNSKQVWDLLGYPYVMFIDWLEAAVIYIDTNNNDDHLNKLLRYIINDGCKLLYNTLKL